MSRKSERDQFRFSPRKGDSPDRIGKDLSDEPKFAAMNQKTRADDDFSQIPAVRTSVDALDGRARLFTGKGDWVTIKLDKEHPEAAIATETIPVEPGQHVVILNSAEGFVAVALAATYSETQFHLYEGNIVMAELSQRNLDANIQLIRNARVVTESELEDLAKNKGIDVVVYQPPRFTAMETIDGQIATAINLLKNGGHLYMITNKKMGSERHQAMMKRYLGDSVEVAEKTKGGYRMIQGVKNSETAVEIPAAQQEINFEIVGQQLSVITEPSLFSKDDLDKGTRFLLESLDLINFERLLDIGSGWGAIGLVAATANPKGIVVMTDVDSRAVRVSQQNIERLGLSDRVAAVATSDIRQLAGNFDLILSNPPFHVDTPILTDILTAARDQLAKKGQIFLVVERTYVKKFENILFQVFGSRARVYQENPEIGFSILTARK